MTLDDYLKREGYGSLARLAKAIGCTQQSIHRARRGCRTVEMARDISRETGIPVADLLAPDVADQIRSAAQELGADVA